MRVKVGTKFMEARALRVAADYVQAQLSDQVTQFILIKRSDLVVTTGLSTLCKNGRRDQSPCRVVELSIRGWLG